MSTVERHQAGIKNPSMCLRPTEYVNRVRRMYPNALRYDRIIVFFLRGILITYDKKPFSKFKSILLKKTSECIHVKYLQLVIFLENFRTQNSVSPLSVRID